MYPQLSSVNSLSVLDYQLSVVYVYYQHCFVDYQLSVVYVDYQLSVVYVDHQHCFVDCQLCFVNSPSVLCFIGSVLCSISSVLGIRSACGILILV